MKRRVKRDERQIPRPRLVFLHNQEMRGVDLTDKVAESYRPDKRGKKWYWPLFINVINLSAISA